MKGSRTIYWIVAGVLAVLLVVMLVTYRYNRSNQEALAKAEQLITAFDKGGLPTPKDPQLVGDVFGTDGRSSRSRSAAPWSIPISAFTSVGLSDVRAYKTPDGSQAVYGHRPGPRGSPTVLLYFHHDVQPPLDEASWQTPVWELTERNGRWYGRAADCKGNIAMHLTALALSVPTCPSASRSSARVRRSRGPEAWRRSSPGTRSC